LHFNQRLAVRLENVLDVGIGMCGRQKIGEAVEAMDAAVTEHAKEKVTVGLFFFVVRLPER